MAIPVQANSLVPNTVEECKTAARRDAIFAGLTSGLASATISSRFMGLNGKLTLVSGVVATGICGYLFHQAFLDNNLAQLRERELAALRASAKQEDVMTDGALGS